MRVEINFLVERLQSMLNGIIASLPNIVLAFLVLLFFYFVGKFARLGVRRVLSPSNKRRGVEIVLGRLLSGLLIFFGVLVGLSIVIPSFRFGDLVQLLGISSVAIGFAFKDILQNYLAGILILITEPFRIGDQIISGVFEGTVEDIQIRSTHLKTYDGRRIVIPNSLLYTDTVIVNTAYASRRVEYDVGIGYGDDPKAAKECILAALKSNENVLQTPAPEAFIVALDDFSVKIRIRWWVTPSNIIDVFLARDTVLETIKDRLSSEGIDLPFPTQNILFHDQTESTDGNRRRQREGWPAGKGEIPASAKVSTAISDFITGKDPKN